VNLATVECTHPLRMHLEVGRRFAGHATSLGKALLAHLTEEDVRMRVGNGPLERFTPNTITSVDQLVLDLACVAERGFSLDTEESIPGIFCVGVPIFNTAGRAATGLSITIPTSRLSSELLAMALSHLAAGSLSISQRMGVRTPSPQLELLRDKERARRALAGTNATNWLHS
jgi:IclR family acetate operon transcriptional repressor